MVIEETHLEGCFVITPKIYKDARGAFFESYNFDKFHKATGIPNNFVQDNQSVSKKDV